MLDPQSSDLTPFIQAAHSQWQTLDLSVAQVSALDDPQFVIADLPGSELAITTGTTITLDIDAASDGWFIDPTPADHREFRPSRFEGELPEDEEERDRHRDLVVTLEE